MLEARDQAIAALQAVKSGTILTLRLGSGTFVDKELFRAACELHREFLPSCVIKPAHADSSDLAKEIVRGEIHATIVTLSVNEPDLQVEELRRDRLVLCLRADHPLAGKPSVRPAELNGHIGFFIIRSDIQKPTCAALVGLIIASQLEAAHPATAAIPVSSSSATLATSLTTRCRSCAYFSIPMNSTLRR